MASPVYIWFKSEVYPWRSFAAICWALVCLLFLLIITIAFGQCSILEPIGSVQGIIGTVLSLHFILMLVVCSLCLITVTWFSLPYLTVVPEVPGTKLSYYLNPFRWSRLPFLVMCALSSAVCTWALLRLVGSDVSRLSFVLDTPEYKRAVLNEAHLFLMLTGIFTGVNYFFKFFTGRKNYLAFPHIQRFKLFQVRSEMSGLLYTSLWQSFIILMYFYPLYFFLGSIPKAWVQTSFVIDTHPDVTPINSVLGILSPRLFWKAYLITVFITFGWTLGITMVKIYLTEQMEFPINSVIQKDANSLLPDAMACSYSGLLQHLAFYDFSRLALFSPERRQELLSLSQPGGHPRIWTAVSGTSLSVIRELTDKVREENSAIVSRVTLSTHQHFSYGDSATFTTYFRGRTGLKSNDTSTSRVENKSPSVVTRVTTSFSNMPFVSSLLSPFPDASTKTLFASCQLQIWAVEALSLMASKSYIEDKYGIVQGSLAAIFSALLDLHEAIEKHFKLTPSLIHRSGQGSNIDPVSTLPYKLQAVTKSSIYRMVVTYNDHLEDLRLGPDYFRRLQPFADFAL